jgi:PTS system nitrogen regulatory IIA component
MNLGDLLTPRGVISSLRAKSKKHALQELSQRAAQLTGLDARNVFEALWHRERLGSTGLGRGVGIPHAKFRGLSSMVCLFARLEEPVPFDALDGEPVDLIFVLLAPEHASGDHLKTLARISRLVRDPETMASLRAAKDTASLLAVLTDPVTSHAA